jgi:hypothetical protein
MRAGLSPVRDIVKKLVTRAEPSDNHPVLRDKNLIPLSHQHQHALALCLRIDRGTHSPDISLEPWLAEIQFIFDQEIRIHFAAEERVLFPAAEAFADLRALAAELRQDHETLRAFFSRAAARTLDQPGLREFAATLSRHIRTEERQLFEGMQQRMSPAQLVELGARLDHELAAASQACIVPREATRLRAK